MSVRSRIHGVASVLFAAIVGFTMLCAPQSVGADSQAVATEQVYVRSGASTDSPILGELWGGDVVWLTGYEENGFYEIWYGDYIAYAYSDYISVDGYVADTPADTSTDVPAATGSSAIVDYALQFVGSPYVWAGADPSGFDCSGFTMYVVQNVLGYDITHSADIQAGYGSPVGWGEWAPGDLVFFSGTGASGYYSHVGIYIGDGQMVHAENESTGVTISSLYSDYYTSHYAYAVRL